ncbi:hypothetical protein AHAS_Ahas18G0204200 [Arachis hypogaea]
MPSLNIILVCGLENIKRTYFINERIEGPYFSFAAEVFHGLQEQVMTTASRSHRLIVRVQNIEASLPPLEKAVLAQTSHIHFAYTSGLLMQVEHIIREENMMAAQEIIELFCELIAVRLPIIEAQRECPLDLKEAISSVQQAFAAKYGKEFLSAATELRPDYGVNCQLIELLLVRAPSPEKKLNLLKEIVVEHEIEWDPAASETEFFKKHEDLLNGPTQFVGSNVPPPEEKQDEESNTAPDTFNKEQPDSDSDSDILDFPDVP